MDQQMEKRVNIIPNTDHIEDVSSFWQPYNTFNFVLFVLQLNLY